MSELVTYEPASRLEESERRRWVALMKPAAELAKAVTGTEFVKGSIRHNPGAIAACVLYGDEVGLGPMQALAQISVIDGRPALSAEAMRALILARGHELWVEESTISKATIAGRRRESEQTSRVTWTMDDARRANLAGKQNWRTYPRQMLAARATAELARLIFADAIGGLALVEELDEETGAPRKRELAPVDNGQRRKRDETTLSRSTRTERSRSDEDEDRPPLPGETHYGPDEPPSGRAFRMMHVLFRETGIDDRADRLRYASELVERPLASTKELTAPEVSRVIGALEERQQLLSKLRASGDESAEAPGDVLPSAGGDVSEESRDDTDARDASNGEADELGNVGESISLAIFRARQAGEGLSDEAIGRVGRELYPGRSLNDLSGEELHALIEAALEQKRKREEFD